MKYKVIVKGITLYQVGVQTEDEFIPVGSTIQDEKEAHAKKDKLEKFMKSLKQ